jgi:predicted lipoprotein with Yx(FWY)xxD motif
MRNSSSGRWRGVVVALFAGLLLTACASGATSTAAVAPSSSGGAAVLMTHTGPLGTYLTDSSGKTLYMFAPDTAGKSVCNGPCATVWPPFTTTGTPVAGNGVTASMISTFARSDGNTQVVYNGHPLYYFQGDKSVGDTTGQGINSDGGLWWVVDPTGNAIQSPAPSASPSGK